MTSGELIAALRGKQHMTQAKLSDISGVPQTTISGIENTQKTPGLKTAVKLAEALGVTPEELLPKEEVK